MTLIDWLGWTEVLIFVGLVLVAALMLWLALGRPGLSRRHEREDDHPNISL